MTPLRLTFVFAAALTFATPLAADPDPGAYLAARQAGGQSDFTASSKFYAAALLADPTNIDLMERTVAAYVSTGQINEAVTVAGPLIAAGVESQIANIALMAHAARTEDWTAIFENLEAGHEVGPLLDGLVQGWANLGRGEFDRALASFDEVIDTPGLRAFGQEHKALALTVSGDLEAASAIYALPRNEGFTPTPTSVVAHLQILARLGEFGRARDIFDRAFNDTSDPELATLRAALEAGEVPDLTRTVNSASHGVSYAFRGLSNILQGEANEVYLVLYAQAARYIAPQDAQAQIATARLLTALEQYDAAALTFAQVATDDPAFQTAEIGRADALRRAGRAEQAIEVLTQLTRSDPDQPQIYASLGDIHRQEDNLVQAAAAYDAALEGYPEGASSRWWLLYARGIVHERLDEWPDAEADFRAALALNPDDPSILNYLGYSIVDRGISDKYDEALGMIEAAVAARPDSGAITDSLAWVYYKLGRYQDAVGLMESAAELEPNDPVVSDHLGDVYWQVGRATEARFQWRRALSFNPEEDEANRIRRKLEIGLDAVYREDGVTPAPAVDVANDDI